jgi:hypothetical protein
MGTAESLAHRVAVLVRDGGADRFRQTAPLNGSSERASVDCGRFSAPNKERAAASKHSGRPRAPTNEKAVVCPTTTADSLDLLPDARQRGLQDWAHGIKEPFGGVLEPERLRGRGGGSQEALMA